MDIHILLTDFLPNNWASAAPTVLTIRQLMPVNYCIIILRFEYKFLDILSSHL